MLTSNGENLQKIIGRKTSSGKECSSHFIKKIYSNNNKNEAISKSKSEYCHNCGSIQANEKVKFFLFLTIKNFAIKPKEYDYTIEIDPSTLLENMLKKDNNFDFKKKSLEDSIADQSSDFPEIYIRERKNLLLLIKKMLVKLRFTQQTFYKAILFLDIFVYKQSEMQEEQLQLTAVASLILAGIFY